MVGIVHNVSWVALFLVVSRLRVVCVAVTSSPKTTHRGSEKSSELGRPCLDKYRTIASHTACLPPSARSAPLDLRADDIKLIVDAHNTYRSRVVPPATNMLKMSWDDEIAMVAQAWAETCSMGHDEAKNRDIPGRLSLGQNVGDGFSTWTAVIDAWFMEARDFTYGGDNNVFEDTGHYTQGVWADSNKLGCGASHCGNIMFYVCNYGPAGNIDPMNKPYKTGQSCSECPLHCENNLCACGDLVCENGGKMVRESCQCHCRHRWLVERECKLNCSAVSEPRYCGKEPFDREGCGQYENVPHECPTTCQICPYGDGEYKEGSAPLSTPDNNNDNNPSNNNESNGKGNTSVGSSIHQGDLYSVLFLLCVGMLC